jgi:MFS family permease
MEDWLELFNHPSDTETGALVSSYCIGALLGCILNFFTGDRLGRRKSMWLAMGFVIVGATLQTSAYTVPHLVIGRVITGLGTGIGKDIVSLNDPQVGELIRANRQLNGTYIPERALSC